MRGEDAADLIADFSAMIRLGDAYDQIRYLDAAGKEKVRVQRENGAAVVVPDVALQDKSEREYFQEGMRADGGYVSRFDLNVENGEIQRPLKPVLRFAAGVDGSDGNRIGIVVLNYSGKRILSRLKMAPASSEGRLFLVNADGYWLIGPAPEVEWGFMIPGLEDATFQAEYPKEWQRISANESGQFETDEGLFTFAALDLRSVIGQRGGRAEESWKIVSRVPCAKLIPSWRGYAWFTVAVVMILLAAGVYVWSSAQAARESDRLRLQKAEERFRTIVGNVPGVVYRCDPDEHWTMRFISRDVEELTGRPAEDFIDNRRLAYAEVIHPDDVDMVDRVVNEAVAEDRPFTVDYRIIRSDGELRNVYERGVGVYGPDGGVLCLDGVIVDNTEQKKAQQALKDSESMLRAMSEASHEALVVIRHDDTVALWNPAAERMFGYSAEEAIGQCMHNLITLPEDRNEAHKGLPEFGRTGRGPVVGSMSEMSAVRKGGEVFPVERSVAAFQRGGDWYAVGGLRDITERKKAEERLRELATTDGLTGLNNRRYFMELAGRELTHAERYGEVPAGVMFDVDHFKVVNDTYGHDAGDDVLRALSSLALETFRDVDVVGRLGGEEFGVILPKVDIGNAVLAAERFRKAVEGAVIPTSAGELTITVSIGVSVMEPGTDNVEALLKRADQALYEAKNSGRNKVVSSAGDDVETQK